MATQPPTLSTAAIRMVPRRAGAERRARRWSAVGPVVLGIGGVVALLAFWQLYAMFGPMQPGFLPAPSAVLPRFVADFGYVAFWTAVGQTMWAWLLSLAISSVSALAVGLVIGSSQFLRRATHSTIEFLRPIPSVGLIPIAALVFGPRIGSELLVVVYGCFWIVVIQVLYGVADVDKVASDTVRTLGMNYFQRVRHLVLPTMLPYYFTGLRLAATVALILTVSTELIIGTPGLGRSIAQAQLNDSMTDLLALVIMAGVLGIVINLSARFLERRLLFWHGSVRSELGS
ncbi:ABC transporter permease [Lysinimonas soli]|uniref:ABC transporter permease n=1 Tax=Lysinimonas soli TaxID=1074233 RepID=A0ABW0NQ66_9MICO